MVQQMQPRTSKAFVWAVRITINAPARPKLGKSKFSPIIYFQKILKKGNSVLCKKCWRTKVSNRISHFYMCFAQKPPREMENLWSFPRRGICGIKVKGWSFVSWKSTNQNLSSPGFPLNLKRFQSHSCRVTRGETVPLMWMVILLVSVELCIPILVSVPSHFCSSSLCLSSEVRGISPISGAFGHHILYQVFLMVPYKAGGHNFHSSRKAGSCQPILSDSLGMEWGRIMLQRCQSPLSQGRRKVFLPHVNFSMAEVEGRAVSCPYLFSYNIQTQNCQMYFFTSVCIHKPATLKGSKL